MTKRNKIIYWIATLWISLGMISSGIVQLFKVKEGVEFIINLGYPDYFVSILGLWKILGVVAILVPKFPLVKEWAYAGFFFMMTGAVYSHIVMKSSMNDIYGPILLIALTIVSWYFRPDNRKLILK